MVERIHPLIFVAGRRAPASTGGAPAWPVIGFPASPSEVAAASDVLEGEPGPSDELFFDEIELARICASVDRAARHAERQEMTLAIEGRTASALESIAAAVGALDAAFEARLAELRRMAAQLAAAAVEALGVTSPARLAARLTESLADECLGRLDPLLPLTVEVSAEMVDPLAAAIGRPGAVPLRPGRISIEPASGLALGEARLVWPDGHAEWSASDLRSRAAAILDGLAVDDDGNPAIFAPTSARNA